MFTAPLQLKNNHNQTHSKIHILKSPKRKTHFGDCLKFRKLRCSWPFCYNEMVWERRTSPWRQQRNSHAALVRCHFHHPTLSVTGSSFGPVPAPVPACHSHCWAIDLSMAVEWGEADKAAFWWENPTQQIKHCYYLIISYFTTLGACKDKMK